MTIRRTVQGVELSLSFDLDPPVSQLEIVSESEDRSRTVYEADGYALTIEEQRGENHTLAEFSSRITGALNE